MTTSVTYKRTIDGIEKISNPVTSGSITPVDDNTDDVGSTAKRYKNLYLAGLTISSGTTSSGALVPSTDATYDIGSALLRYKDIYNSGVLYNSTSVNSDNFKAFTTNTYGKFTSNASQGDGYFRFSGNASDSATAASTIRIVQNPAAITTDGLELGHTSGSGAYVSTGGGTTVAAADGVIGTRQNKQLHLGAAWGASPVVPHITLAVSGAPFLRMNKISKFYDSTDATSTATGSVQCDGGISCVKKIFAGDQISTTKLLATNTTNQIVLGTTNTTTISATAPSASRVYTLPDVGSSTNIVTEAGANTFSNQTNRLSSADGFLSFGPASATNTNQTFRFRVASYATGAPFLTLGMKGIVTDNIVYLGGGISSVNAATKILQYAANNLEIDTGTLVTTTDINGFTLESGSLTCASGTTLKANTLTSTTTNGDLTISGNGTGVVVIGDGLKFPTSGGTPASLTYYEEYSASVTFTGTGVWTTTESVAITITQIGKLITLHLPLTTQTSINPVTGTAFTTDNTAVPSRFRPANNTYWTVQLTNSAEGGVTGYGKVASAGAITLDKQTLFTNAVTVGWPGLNLHWTI